MKNDSTMLAVAALSLFAFAACAHDSTPDGEASDAVTSELATKRFSQSTIVDFDASKYELPEALAYRAGYAYVSLAPLATIEKVSIDDGSRSTFAHLPIAASNLVLGSIFDDDGNLFVGVGATNWNDAEGMAAAGVYEIDPAGNVKSFASAAQGLKFGNGLSFDGEGNLYVSDAAEGAVYRFSRQGAVGTATPWMKHEALTGDQSACPGMVAGFPLGANGIYAEHGAVWIGNTDRGTLLRIDVRRDGSAGALKTVAQSCDVLEGLDGLRPDPRAPKERFIGTNNPKHQLVVIGRDGEARVMYEPGVPALDGPADLVEVSDRKGIDLLVVNSAFPEAFAPPALGLVPHPSLVKITNRP
jgi:hypothetical protein